MGLQGINEKWFTRGSFLYTGEVDELNFLCFKIQKWLVCASWKRTWWFFWVYKFRLGYTEKFMKLEKGT